MVNHINEWAWVKSDLTSASMFVVGTAIVTAPRFVTQILDHQYWNMKARLCGSMATPTGTMASSMSALTVASQTEETALLLDSKGCRYVCVQSSHVRIGTRNHPHSTGFVRIHGLARGVRREGVRTLTSRGLKPSPVGTLSHIRVAENLGLLPCFRVMREALEQRCLAVHV